MVQGKHHDHAEHRDENRQMFWTPHHRILALRTWASCWPPPS
jgi:hypothetical protein